MSVIVLGTVAIDNIKTSSGEHKGLLGGSAAHFAMSARLFAPVHIAGVVGQNFPQAHKRFLEERQLDISSLSVQDGGTFEWTGEYDDNDLNAAITLDTELGVLAEYQPMIADQQKTIPHVFLANIDPEVQIKFLDLMQKPKLVGLDSMNLWIDIKRSSLVELMKRVDLFVANDGEARMLTQEKNLIKAARAIRKMGPPMVVIKKGEHGVLFYCDDYMFAMPAYPVEQVVDPTGAGDTFAGAIMGYLSQFDTWSSEHIKKALIYATVLSSFNVEAFGMSKTGDLDMSTVEARKNELLNFVSVPSVEAFVA